MARPFNFFQFDGTGIFQESGYVVDPLSYGLLTGFFTPADILSAQQSGRAVNLLSESFILPPDFLINIQGLQQSSNIDKTNLTFDFYGDFVPLIKESGTLNSFEITGQIVKCDYDRPAFSININGDYGLSTRENNTLSCLISGLHGVTASDRPNLNFKFTGNFDSIGYDRPIFKIFFSGGYGKPPLKDSMQFNMIPTGIQWSVGNLLQTTGISDNANFNFGFAQTNAIIWTP